LLPELRGGHGPAEAGFLFQVGEGSEEEAPARIFRVEQKVGSEGESAENPGGRSQGRGEGAGLGGNFLVIELRECLGRAPAELPGGHSPACDPKDGLTHVLEPRWFKPARQTRGAGGV
jgi:hypothetical protein